MSAAAFCPECGGFTHPDTASARRPRPVRFCDRCNLAVFIDQERHLTVVPDLPERRDLA